MRQPLGSLMTMSAIGLALALPAGLSAALSNAEGLAAAWGEARSFSIYLKGGTGVAVAEQLAADLERNPAVGAVRRISPAEALAIMEGRSEFAGALETMADNPLPWTLVVTPAPAAADTEFLVLKTTLATLDEVDEVLADTEWLQRLGALLTLAGQALLLVLFMVLVALVVIIGNTIRLEVQKQDGALEVLALLGASRGYMRRPFLYQGFWYGLGGGLVALGLVRLGIWGLGGSFSELMALYDSERVLSGAGWRQDLLILGLGVLTGWLGAWRAVAGQMRRIG
ncbi:MAG: permease-like cell division protein FtsX [Gammaproteobacteria bacterium]|nr:permease-like cell division protein FtsX [Gammaproteobacteria bacterium]MCY4339976.1 permease-like cell division protein FtsX [Gammaproteobacteria bacterium]